MTQLAALSVKLRAATPHDSRRGVFAAEHGSSKEVVVASTLTERIDVDVASFVAREDQTSTAIEERLEQDLEVQGSCDSLCSGHAHLLLSSTPNLGGAPERTRAVAVMSLCCKSNGHREMDVCDLLPARASPGSD